MKLKNRSLTIDHKIYVSNDTIYKQLNDGQYVSFGTYNPTDGFAYHAGYYILTHNGGADSPPAFEKGGSMQLQSHQTIFLAGKVFESPEDVKKVGDTIAWCNVFYTFKKQID